MERRSSGRKLPLQVAVMGCVVNGPGEARDADIGIAAGTQARPPVREGRRSSRVVPEDEMVDDARRVGRVHQRARRRAAIAAGRHREGRRARPQQDRAALLDEQGDDANHERADASS